MEHNTKSSGLYSIEGPENYANLSLGQNFWNALEHKKIGKFFETFPGNHFWFGKSKGFTYHI